MVTSTASSRYLAVGIGFRHGDPDVADREADLGADLEELQANRLTLSASQGGLLQSETTQGVHHVGGGGQIQPELIDRRTDPTAVLLCGSPCRPATVEASRERGPPGVPATGR